MDGAEFFFEGARRLDWGLGNPNKTAALIAEGMVAVWSIAYIRQRLCWLSAFLFTVLGCCLVLTFSRGGLAACCVGLAVLAAFTPRPWPKRNMIMVALSVLVIAIVAVRFNACRRYSQGIIAEDRSVTNRIVLWQAAPVMIADAPGGWGVGNAGKAYMQWYQPVDRYERYRTLVNSHLTWLVEFGWPLRFLYVFGWLAVFLLCGAGAGRKWRVVPLGIWTAFGTAAFFSSVAESPWLWTVPLASLIAVLAIRARLRQWPSFRNWMWPACLSALLCVGLWVAGRHAGSPIKGGRHRIFVGSGVPTVWLVADEKCRADESYARKVRERTGSQETGFCVGVVWAFGSLPGKVYGARIVMMGTPDGIKRSRMREVLDSASRLILLAPGFYPYEAGLNAVVEEKVEVLFGEFSQSPFLQAWEETGRVRRVAGVGDYFPDWPERLCGPLNVE